MPPGMLAAFVAVAVLAVIVAITANAAARQRREALARLAADLGLDFDPRDDSRHDDRYAQFAIFRRGHSRCAYNTLAGTMDLFGHRCQVRLGDFRYEEDDADDKGSTTYRFSYLIVHPPWRTPSLLIRPEGLFDKIKGAFGFEDIDFESQEFSRKFYVQSSDKRFAYDVLHPRMMEFLLAERPPAITIAGEALCLSDGKHTWQPQDLRDRLAFLLRFGELWPRHLAKDLLTKDREN